MAQDVAKINISVFWNQYAVALSERWLSIDAAELIYIKNPINYGWWCLLKLYGLLKFTKTRQIRLVTGPEGGSTPWDVPVALV